MKSIHPILTLLAVFVTTTLCGWAEYQSFSRSQFFFFTKDYINAYFFKSSTHRLFIMDEGSLDSPRYGSLDQAMRQSPCIAGINGGFFCADSVGSPLGALVTRGEKITSPLSGAFTVSGILWDSGRDIYLQRSQTFLNNKPASARVLEAIQGGPFLVEHGQPTHGLNNTKSAVRSLIATDGKGNWCIAITSSLTLYELAHWLTIPGALGNFSVQTALNLDGGTSTAFWCYEVGIYIPSSKQVRNYIGIAPRDS